MKSDILKNKIETLPHRALLMSAGLKKEDFALDKPFIGIANSYNTIIPGHIHLAMLAEEVAQGIKDAGGVPFMWGVPGVCDGIAMHVEMRLSLPSREHIADNIRIMMLSHSLDGWVGITNCDKITPGMLMAAGSLNLPAIILTGGPMKANVINNKKCHPIQGFEIVGRVKKGLLSKEEAEAMLPMLACKAGSCVGLFTANTMAIITEALGMSITKCATTLALDPLKKKQAYETGRRIVELTKNGVKPRSIMTQNAFENATRVDMAMGGSTNAVLHIPAIAKEAGINIYVDRFDEISKETPNLCKIIPAGSYEIADVDRAGGVPAVLNRLVDKIKDSLTVNPVNPCDRSVNNRNGKSIREIALEGKVLDDDVIRPLDNPYAKEGSIAILKGNIAESSVLKQTAVDPSCMKHVGPAKVFYSEDELLKAIEQGKISEGDVIVLPYQGQAGAPGMPEMLTPTDAIKGAGYKKVALITDGRFSGGTSGLCIGHIEPEAYNKGTIAAIRNGDIIEIDVPNRTLNVRLSEKEIAKRLSKSKPPERELDSLLDAYRKKFDRRSSIVFC